MSALAEQLSHWLRQQVLAAGANGLVVGLSGGLDSAVVARLCQLATPGEVLAVILPCQSDPQDAQDARLIARHFDLPMTQIDLDRSYDVLVEGIKTGTHGLPEPGSGAPPEDVRARRPFANVKARLRMMTLYYLANTMNYLVAGTGNRCELEIGYYTKYGDGGVDVLPLGRLLKSEVAKLARELDIPEPIIEKPASAGLWIGQTDEAELGFTYDHLEAYVTQGPEAVSPALALRIERMMRSSGHKRQLPPMPPATED